MRTLRMARATCASLSCLRSSAAVRLVAYFAVTSHMPPPARPKVQRNTGSFGRQAPECRHGLSRRVGIPWDKGGKGWERAGGQLQRWVAARAATRKGTFEPCCAAADCDDVRVVLTPACVQSRLVHGRLAPGEVERRTRERACVGPASRLHPRRRHEAARLCGAPWSVCRATDSQWVPVWAASRSMVGEARAPKAGRRTLVAVSSINVPRARVEMHPPAALLDLLHKR